MMMVFYDECAICIRKLEDKIDKLLKSHKAEIEKISKDINEKILWKFHSDENRLYMSFYVAQMIGNHFLDYLLADQIELEEIKLREVLGEEDYKKMKEIEEKGYLRYYFEQAIKAIKSFFDIRAN